MRAQLSSARKCSRIWKASGSMSTLLIPGISRIARPFTKTVMRPAKGHSTVGDTGEAVRHVDRIEYELIDPVETLENYGPGGFHPVAIGDHLHNRYTIVHKLGFGTYSTTWLARDQHVGSYVAIKVGMAWQEHIDAAIFRRLRDLQAATPGRAMFPPVLDEFKLMGPNGTHSCLVTIPARMTLECAKSASCLFQLPVARAIAAQLVQAIALLHSRGVVHGDLSSSNIHFPLPTSINSLTPDRFYDEYGSPKLERVKRINKKRLRKGVPSHAVVPPWLGTESDLVPLSEASILLADFGESFMPSTKTRHHSDIVTFMFPPEAIFLPHQPISFPWDIWALGGSIWEILGSRTLFSPWIMEEDNKIIEQIELFLEMPYEWWEQWGTRSKWFHEDGTLKDSAIHMVDCDWDDYFEECIQVPRREYEMGEVGDEERAALSTLLRSMVAWRPCERPSAEQVLQSEWMRRWALPDLAEMERLRR